MKTSTKISIVIYLIIPLFMASLFLPVRAEQQIFTMNMNMGRELNKELNSSITMKGLPEKVDAFSIYNSSFTNAKEQYLYHEILLFKDIFEMSQISQQYGIKMLLGSHANKSSFANALKEDYYIMYSGEGRYDSVNGPSFALWDNESPEQLDFVGYTYIKKIPTSNSPTKIVFLSSCYSMARFTTSTGDPHDLIYAFQDKGVGAILGFKGEVAVWPATIAMLEFWYYFLLEHYNLMPESDPYNAFDAARDEYNSILLNAIIINLSWVIVINFIPGSFIIEIFNDIIQAEHLDNTDVQHQLNALETALNQLYNIINAPKQVLDDATRSYDLFDAKIFSSSTGYWSLYHSNSGPGKPPRFGTPTIDGTPTNSFEGV